MDFDRGEASRAESSLYSVEIAVHPVVQQTSQICLALNPPNDHHSNTSLEAHNSTQLKHKAETLSTNLIQGVTWVCRVS